MCMKLILISKQMIRRFIETLCLQYLALSAHSSQLVLAADILF